MTRPAVVNTGSFLSIPPLHMYHFDSFSSTELLLGPWSGPFCGRGKRRTVNTRTRLCSYCLSSVDRVFFAPLRVGCHPSLTVHTRLRIPEVLGSEGRWVVTGGHESDSVEDDRLITTSCCFFVRRLEQGWLGRCLVDPSWGRS